MKKYLLVLTLAALSTACLKTRSEVSEEDEKKVIQSQVSQLQRSKADQEANLQGYESQIRNLNGRVEALEHQLNLLANQKEDLTKKLSENDQRFRQLEQAILQVEQGANVQLKPAAEATPEESSSKKGSLFDEAEELYAKKQWKKAVVLYGRYRTKSPNGPDVAAATLKMGICFQEMKLTTEAKPFYEEVIEKYPKSKFAKLAQARLSQLKKK